MRESQIAAVLDDSWDIVDPDAAGSAGEQRVVGAHTDRDVLLYVESVTGDHIDADWLVQAEHTVESNGWRVSFTTGDAFFSHAQRAIEYVGDYADAVSNGSESFQAFAVVPHDGHSPTDTREQLRVTPADLDSDPGFADVFAVREQLLTESPLTIDALRESADDLVAVVLGETADLPDELRELSSMSEAHSEATIEVFTVAQPDGFEPVEEVSSQ